MLIGSAPAKQEPRAAEGTESVRYGDGRGSREAQIRGGQLQQPGLGCSLNGASISYLQPRPCTWSRHRPSPTSRMRAAWVLPPALVKCTMRPIDGGGGAGTMPRL